MSPALQQAFLNSSHHFVTVGGDCPVFWYLTLWSCVLKLIEKDKVKKWHTFSCPGLAGVCQTLESCVTSHLSLPLTARLTLSELEAHLTQVGNLASFEWVEGLPHPASAVWHRERWSRWHLLWSCSLVHLERGRAQPFSWRKGKINKLNICCIVLS